MSYTLKQLDQFLTRFLIEPSVEGVLSICSNHSAIKQDGRHVRGKKTLKNLFLKNGESFKAESWYKASRTQGLPSLFK